jgi:DNA sulfur modification protein DndD
MRLRSIQLTNFRQFYGKTPKVEFAYGTKNVTVIHGMNGAGKTALLNAFTWVLYGSFSKGFRNPERLINNRAIGESPVGKKVECSVELAFDHGGFSYVLRKSMDAVIAQTNDYPQVRSKEYSLLYQDGDNQWKSAPDVDSTIGRILPSDLHSYFFFDGERVERIVDPRREDRADLARAVKTILGLEILERSEKHLRRAKKHFEDEIAKYGSDETKQLVKLKKDTNDKLDDLRKDIQDLEKKCEDQRELLNQLHDRMRKLDKVKDQQVRRDVLIESIRLKRESLKITTQTIKDKLSSVAYILHTNNVGTKFVDIIGELKKKGELPSPLKRDFVEKLLDRSLCICGRSLDPKVDQGCDHARISIQDWLNTAGLQEIEDCALDLGAKVGNWSEIRKDIRIRFDELNSKIRLDLGEIAQFEAELKKIKNELEGSPEEEVSSLEKKISAEGHNRDAYLQEEAIAKDSLRKLSAEMIEHDKNFDKLEKKTAQQQLENRRRVVIDEVIKATDKILELMDLKWRKSLEKKIQTIFREISVKPYIPKLNSDYSIVLEDPASKGDVAFSQGESLVLSFSFIAAIIDEARKLNSQKNDLKGPDSSQYPLVMDSPFGALDPTNRRHVSSKISQLADQVVAMVSKTQWREEVEEAMTPRIGKSWVLTYHSPRSDTLVTEILIGSKTHPLIKRSTGEYEFTTIEEA